MPSPETSDSAPRPTVLFDIDGTLVDTNYFQAVSWFRAFSQSGYQVAMVDVQRHIGLGSSELIDELVPQRDKSRDDVLQAAHAEYYAGFYGLMKPFACAQDLVRTIRDRGAEVVLATSASPNELQALRSALDVEDALATVTSAKDVQHAKPEPDILEAALKQTGTDPEHAIMIGDTVWDIKAAAKAGVRCIAVLTGGISRQALEEAGAVAIYDDAQDLLKNLDDSPIGKLLVASAG
ncbi:MAG TPA: HAD family hydrolase [Frankiaceae bacterium]|nr:HAD family hydrolase [Frankiaceae bacterium]